MHCLQDIGFDSLLVLLDRYCLKLTLVEPSEDIPYSFWGTPEAGRLKSTLFARADTPIHSILHETAHYICMPASQRSANSIDAKGSAVEESACCFLQILLTDYIENVNRVVLMNNMDSWGYSFRLGSTARWFYADSDDAKTWLAQNQLITNLCLPSWRLR